MNKSRDKRNKNDITFKSQEVGRRYKKKYDDDHTHYRNYRKNVIRYYEPVVYQFSYEKMVECIRKLDVLNTKCELATIYKYCRPRIEHANQSFAKMKGLRHVLIEHLEKNELYVTNDIELGGENQGILLFGTNAVGKTSLIKSIGICIIMAQAGLYVPCDSMVYYPYEYLFTRIIGNDNIT
jgi:DNA mismatch repair protein MutS